MATTRSTRMRVNPYKMFLVPLMLVAMASLGAAPPTRIACGQREEADRFVRLQDVTTDGPADSSQRFTHPFALSPEDWKSILISLHVQRQAEGLLFPVPQGPMLPAFSEDEVSYLSVTLSKAFAQAQPDEWIVFGLSQSSQQGLTELTTGGGYVAGPLLHLVLANYRKVVTMPSTRQLLSDRPLRSDAGPAYDLVAGNHQTIVRASGFVPGLLSSAPSELAIAYQALLLGEPGAASVTQKKPTAPNEMAIQRPTIIAPSVSIENQLQVLERLRAQRLLTDEEYRAKRQQLLDRF